MPVLKVYRHGVTAGCPPETPPQPPERTACNGWSPSAIRRNRLFLYSVDESRLSGVGFAFTGTVRTCPPTHENWKRGREAFFDRLRRAGLTRAHWVTEWQKRGIPHLHMAVWFPEDQVHAWAAARSLADDPDKAAQAFGLFLVLQWLEVMESYGAQVSGQHVTPIYDAVGWNQYVSKHAARGLNHYQRNPANIPQGWRNIGTGRMWGKLGTWHVIDPEKAELSMRDFHRFRRIVRGYRLADARQAYADMRQRLAMATIPDQVSRLHAQTRTARRRIGQARRMLQARAVPTVGHDGRIPTVAEACRRLSYVRGCSEWIPEEVQCRILAFLVDDP